MKVLFVIPTNVGRYIAPTIPHAGVAYLIAYLEKHGHQADVIDMRLYPSDSDLLARLADFKPDMVGISTASRGYMIAYRLVDLIKKNAAAPVVIGGPHASTIHEKILEECSADYAVIGEGEETMLELADGKKPAEIRGLVWRNGSMILKNLPRPFITDLDRLPFPAYEKFELDRFIEDRIPIVSSRGCPYNCNYCSVQLVSGKTFRFRSAENVVSEIEHWCRKGYTNFEFADDNFTLLIPRVEKICNLIIEKNLKIKWQLGNGIRVDRVTPELIRLMAKAGCFYICFGVESANPDVLKSIRKGINLDQVRAAIKAAKEAGIEVQASFIIGCSEDTFKTFMETYNFAKSLPLDEVRFFNMVPYPGSEMYEWVKANGSFLYSTENFLNNIDYWNNQPIFETSEFTKEERIRAYALGETLVMRLFLRRRFGGAAGSAAFAVWNNQLVKKHLMNQAKQVWVTVKKLEKKLSSLGAFRRQ